MAGVTEMSEICWQSSLAVPPSDKMFKMQHISDRPRSLLTLKQYGPHHVPAWHCLSALMRRDMLFDY